MTPAGSFTPVAAGWGAAAGGAAGFSCGAAPFAGADPAILAQLPFGAPENE